MIPPAGAGAVLIYWEGADGLHGGLIADFRPMGQNEIKTGLYLNFSGLPALQTWAREQGYEAVQASGD